MQTYDKNASNAGKKPSGEVIYTDTTDIKPAKVPNDYFDGGAMPPPVSPITPSGVLDVINTVSNPASGYKYSSGSGSSDSMLDSLTREFESMYDRIYDLTQENNAQMRANAERQMQFQDQSQAKQMAFNSEQAKLDRDWQEMMSNTAHQREVQDLIAAGLNPVLSANGGAAIGSGASASVQAQSGSEADVDTSLTNFAGNMLGAIASMHNAETSAKAALGAASINAAASQAIARMQLSQPGTLYGTINMLLNNAWRGLTSGKSVAWSDSLKQLFNL